MGVFGYFFGQTGSGNIIIFTARPKSILLNVDKLSSNFRHMARVRLFDFYDFLSAVSVQYSTFFVNMEMWGYFFLLTKTGFYGILHRYFSLYFWLKYGSLQWRENKEETLRPS